MSYNIFDRTFAMFWGPGVYASRVRIHTQRFRSHKVMREGGGLGQPIHALRTSSGSWYIRNFWLVSVG